MTGRPDGFWLGGLGLALLLCAWLPTDHYPPWFGFHGEVLAFAGFTLVFLACLSTAGQRIEVPRIAMAVAVLAALPWLQWFAGLNAYLGDAVLSSVYLVGFAAAILAGAHVGGPGRTAAFLVSGLMHVLWLAAMMSAGIGVVQWLGLGAAFGPLGAWMVQLDAGDRAMGNIGQPNQLATLLLMGMAAYVHARRQLGIGRAGFALGIAFMTLALVLSQSRTGLLSGLALAAFLAWKSRHGFPGPSPRLLFIWAVLFVLAFMALPSVSEFLYLGKGRGMALTENNARWVLWQQVSLGILQSPWWGYGWNQTASAHMAGAALLPGTLTITHAHNLFLDLSAWAGIPVGTALALAGIYWTVSRIRRSEQPQSVLAMACLLPILIHSLLEYPFAYAYFMLYAGLMAGIVEVSVSPSPARTVHTGLLWGLAAFGLAVGGWIVHEYLLIEEDFRHARFEGARIGVAPPDYRSPQIRLITHMGAMLDAGRVKPRPGMSNEELARLQLVAQRFPYSTMSFRYALALGLNGEPDEAGRQMALMRNLYGEGEYAVLKARLAREREAHPQLHAVPSP